MQEDSCDRNVDGLLVCMQIPLHAGEGPSYRQLLRLCRVAGQPDRRCGELPWAVDRSRHSGARVGVGLRL